MANLHRGEIDAILDGQPLRLCLTLGALAELESTFGNDDMLAVAERFIFRYRPRAVAKHVGILTDPAHMIHAIEGAVVGEVPLGTWWRRHMVAAFSFPGIES